MDELTLGLDEELELDYETEVARKAKEIADIQEKDEKISDDEDDNDADVTDEDNNIPASTFQEQKLSNLRKRKSSPPKWNRGIINDDDEVEPGRDIIRPKKNLLKRFRYQPELLPDNFFPDEKDPDVIVDKDEDDHPPLKKSELAMVFDSLDVDMDNEDLSLNTILVKGVEGMSHYQLEKVFAEYHPHIVLFVEDDTCIVQFRQSRIAAKMLNGMTKKLKRVRAPKKIEEGEIMESGDETEEGQTYTDKDGETVHVRKEIENNNTEQEDDEVPIDITKFKVPKGKWRVVTRHIPSNKILIVRYADEKDIRKADRNTANTQYRSDRASETKSRYARLKGGLNVFDDTGKELPWNFEHDTRIFDDPSLKHIDDEKDQRPQQPREENIKIGNRIIHSKGRGTKRALNLHFSSDEEESDDDPNDNDDGATKKAVNEDAILNSPTPSPPKASDNFRSHVLNSK